MKQTSEKNNQSSNSESIKPENKQLEKKWRFFGSVILSKSKLLISLMRVCKLGLEEN